MSKTACYHQGKDVHGNQIDEKNVAAPGGDLNLLKNN